MPIFYLTTNRPTLLIGFKLLSDKRQALPLSVLNYSTLILFVNPFSLKKFILLV